MDCPRCKGFVTENKGGYQQAKMDEDRSLGIMVPAHYQCVNCGWYKEESFDSLDKNIINEDRCVGEKSVYFGDVKRLVIEHWDLLVYYHSMGLGWKEIHRRTQDKMIAFKTINPNALCNTYHRVRKDKELEQYEHNK